MFSVIADFITFSVLRLSPNSRFGESLNFALYDFMKIIALLFAMISVIGFLRTYLSAEKFKRAMTGRNPFLSALTAAIFGAITPFCSCSSIPIFLSFIKAGVPTGTAFSFLTASPLINQYLVVLMIGFFGLKITAIYILCGIIIGVSAGLVMGKMGVEKYLEKDFLEKNNVDISAEIKGFKNRVRFGVKEGKDITVKIWKWVLLGVALGSIIHNYVPDDMVHSLMNKGGVFAVPLAVLAGVPMYGSCAAILPIAVVLFEKGVPLGTALAFTMAVSGLSLPEAVILRRAMNLKLIALFFGIVAVGIILIGYTINLF